MTLRAYEDVLMVMRDACTNPYFQRAARGAVSAYLKLIDPPKIVPASKSAATPTNTVDDVLETSNLSAAEQKKMREKLRKQQKKKEKRDRERENVETKEHNEYSNSHGVENGKSKESEELAAMLTKPPLDEAVRICGDMVRLPIAEAASFSVAFEVYLKRRKLCLALRCLCCGLKRCPLHPGLMVQLVKFSLIMQTNPEISDTAQETISSVLNDLLGGSTVSSFVGTFVSRAVDLSLQHRIAAARCLLLLQSSSEVRSRAVDLITGEKAWEGRGVTVDAVEEAYKVNLT